MWYKILRSAQDDKKRLYSTHATKEDLYFTPADKEETVFHLPTKTLRMYLFRVTFS